MVCLVNAKKVGFFGVSLPEEDAEVDGSGSGEEDIVVLGLGRGVIGIGETGEFFFSFYELRKRKFSYL